MSILNENNSTISTNNFLRDCIDLAIDGFLFRGIKPSDHYYRFSQSFPKAFQLLSTYSNLNNSSVLTTPKHSHHVHSSKHQRTTTTTTTNVPPLDLSSLNSNILLEQQPVSTIMTTNSTGITIKTKKPVYSPKDSLSSSTTTERRSSGGRRPGSSSNKTPLVTSNTPNTPLSSNEQSPSTKRNLVGPSSSADAWNSPQQLSSLEIEAREIQERMTKHRLKHGRPNDFSLMTQKQIYDEKCDMQQELLRFESKYSKPTTSEQKRIMKPLYDYYRQLKRLVEKQQQT